MEIHGITIIGLLLMLLVIREHPADLHRIWSHAKSATTARASRNLKEYEQIYPLETKDLGAEDWQDMTNASQQNNVGETKDLGAEDWQDMTNTNKQNNVGVTLDLSGHGWTDMTNYSNLLNNIPDVTTEGIVTSESGGLTTSAGTGVVTDIDTQTSGFDLKTSVPDSQTPVSDLPTPVFDSPTPASDLQTPVFDSIFTTVSYKQLDRGVEAKTIEMTTSRMQSDMSDKNVEQTKEGIMDLSSTVQPDTSSARDGAKKTSSVSVDEESSSRASTADPTSSLSSLSIYVMVFGIFALWLIVGGRRYIHKCCKRGRNGQSRALRGTSTATVSSQTSRLIETNKEMIFTEAEETRTILNLF